MYAQRDKDGKIVGLFRWPNELAEKEPIEDDAPEIEAFYARKTEAPVSVDSLVRALVKKGLITEQDLKNGHQ